MAGEDSILLASVGQRERVIVVNINGQDVAMETVVSVEGSERREYDADQRVIYIGRSILRGAETAPIWMIWKITYDVNGNETGRYRASVAYDQKWSERANIAEADWK